MVYGLLILKKRRSLSIRISLLSLSPWLVGLDSERVVFLGWATDWALALGISGTDDELEDGGGCGADFLLERIFGSCGVNPLRAVDSGLEPVRLGVLDGG